MSKHQWQKLNYRKDYLQAFSICLKCGKQVLTPQIKHGNLGECGKPKIVCLCGSTRFKREFIEANFKESMKGHIVLSVGWYSHTDGEIYTPTQDEKLMLDNIYLRKVSLADEILVINVNGYIGASTTREIAYAKILNKPIRFLEPHKDKQQREKGRGNCTRTSATR
jgi:hypothetical protein